jgi:hypothetical protein
VKIEERLELLKQVANVATLAGLKGRIDENGKHFVMGFDMKDGRGQQVFVRPNGYSPEGAAIVTMWSPAHVFAKGLFGSISKDQAVELLKMNENGFFARYGVWVNEKETVVIVSWDLLLSTLDPDELRAQAYCVAYAADAYEAKHRKDKF